MCKAENKSEKYFYNIFFCPDPILSVCHLLQSQTMQTEEVQQYCEWAAKSGQRPGRLWSKALTQEMLLSRALNSRGFH